MLYRPEYQTILQTQFFFENLQVFVKIKIVFFLYCNFVYTRILHFCQFRYWGSEVGNQVSNHLHINYSKRHYPSFINFLDLNSWTLLQTHSLVNTARNYLYTRYRIDVFYRQKMHAFLKTRVFFLLFYIAISVNLFIGWKMYAIHQSKSYYMV